MAAQVTWPLNHFHDKRRTDLASVPAFTPRSIQRPTWNEISKHTVIHSSITTTNSVQIGKGLYFCSFSLSDSSKYTSVFSSRHLRTISSSLHEFPNSSCRRSRSATPGFAEAIVSRTLYNSFVCHKASSIQPTTSCIISFSHHSSRLLSTFTARKGDSLPPHITQQPWRTLPAAPLRPSSASSTTSLATSATIKTDM